MSKQRGRTKSAEELKALWRSQRNTAWTALLVLAVLGVSILALLITTVTLTEANVLHQRLIRSTNLSDPCNTQLGSWFLVFAVIVFAIGCALVYFSYRTMTSKPSADLSQEEQALKAPEAPYQKEQLYSIVWFLAVEALLAASLVSYLVQNRSIYTSPMPTDIHCVNHEYWFTASMVFISWILVIPVIILTYGLRTFVITSLDASERLAAVEEDESKSTVSAGSRIGAAVRKHVSGATSTLSANLGLLGSNRTPPV